MTVQEDKTVTKVEVVNDGAKEQPQSFKERLRTAGKLISESFNVLTGGKK